MKYAILLIYVWGILSQTLCSQERVFEKKSIVFLEFMGAADEGVGIGYEHYFLWNDVSRSTLRAGISKDFQHDDVPVFLGGSLIFGKRHNLEIGLNYMRKDPEDFYIENLDYDFNEEYSSENSQFFNVTKRRDIYNFLLGYRYQNERSGIMIRHFIGTKVKRSKRLFGDPGIHVGASFGIAF